MYTHTYIYIYVSVQYFIYICPCTIVILTKSTRSRTVIIYLHVEMLTENQCDWMIFTWHSHFMIRQKSRLSKEVSLSPSFRPY